MKKYLISYGDHNYASQKEFFKESAIASDFFDEVSIFGPEDIAPEFNLKAREVLQHRKGGGYWIWKPYFIKRMFEQMEENDILFYCDAGCMINRNGRDRFTDYISMLNLSETGTLDFELPFKEYQYTKREVFDYFKSSEEVVNSNQLMATVLLFKKCDQTRLLLKKWYDTVTGGSFLFTDEQKVKQLPGFIDHRHDQSIFSVIRKTIGANVIPDETYFTDFLREGHKFPFWAARLRG